MTNQITGSCFCGKIKYELTSTPLTMGICHCHSCQKFSGCGYYAWVHVSKNAITFTGEIKEYASMGGSGNIVYRGYCGDCGSRLSSRGEWLGDTMTVSAGSLDDPSLFKPQMHFWTSEAQIWDWIDPTMMQFEKGPKK